MQEEVLSNPDVNKFVRNEAVVSLARSNAFHPKLIQLLRDGKIQRKQKLCSDQLFAIQKTKRCVRLQRN